MTVMSHSVSAAFFTEQIILLDIAALKKLKNLFPEIG